MPVSEETFYNIIGEEINRTNLVQQMIDFYGLKLNVGETKVTDFNEGSEIRNLLESFAVDLYHLMENQEELSQIGFIDTADGEWLDKHGQHPFINLPRDTGMEAGGFVTFTLVEANVEDITIPDETVLFCTENELSYMTEGDVVIPAGDTEVVASAVCLSVGSDGNCHADTITVIDDDYFNVDGISVTNNNSFTGGSDYEEDEEYRERLLEYVRQDDFGSMGYYTKLGQNVNGVHDIALVDDPNEVYTKIVVVNGKTKPVTNEVLANVLTAFTDITNIVVGHSFTVASPNYKTVDLDVTVSVLETVEDSVFTELLNCIFDGGDGNMIIGYDYEGLNLGDPLVKSKIYPIFESLDVVDDIYIEYNGSELSTITTATDEVLKLGTVTITQVISGS